MPSIQTRSLALVETSIDASDAFGIARKLICKHVPDCWEPPFSISYHEQAEQWIVSTKTDALRGNAEIIIDAFDGRVIDVSWTPLF